MSFILQPANLNNTIGTLPASSGGTGATTLTLNNVILGNGTSPVNFVAPGASGNILSSDGTTWVSSTPATGGGAAQPFITMATGNNQLPAASYSPTDAFALI
jgi:hypothetical protein